MLYDVKSLAISSADALGPRCLGWRTSGSVWSILGILPLPWSQRFLRMKLPRSTIPRGKSRKRTLHTWVNAWISESCCLSASFTV
jgi:hypothetical protein